MSNRNTFLKIILWVFALEVIRNKYNNLERLAHQEEWDKSILLKKQKTLLLVASLIYGIFISFVILNFLISLTQKITSVYPDTEFLKSNVALLSTVMLSYIVSVVVMRHGIQLYIKKINGLPAFCRRVGLKVWNSTKIVGQVPRKATEVIVKGTQTGFTVFGKVGKKTGSLAVKGSKQVIDKTTKGARFVGKIGSFVLGLGAGLTSMGIKGAGRVLSKIFKKK